MMSTYPLGSSLSILGLLALFGHLFFDATAAAGSSEQRRRTSRPQHCLPIPSSFLCRRLRCGGDDSSLVESPPEGLFVKDNVISEETWKIIKQWLSTDEFPRSLCSHNNNNIIPIPWQIGAQNRSVAQFGFRYDYDSSQVEFDESIPDIPEPLKRLLLDACQPIWKQQQQLQQSEQQPNFTQCIINVYEPDTIIPWHWDHVDFGSVILVIVLGEDRPLHLRRLLITKQPTEDSMILPKSQCNHDEDSAEYDANDFEYYTAYPKHRSCYILSGPARYQWEHSVPKGSGRRISFTFRTHTGQHNLD